jgi:hypothetical protein
VADVTLPVTGKNAASFARDAGGNTAIKDAGGRVLATVPAPEMWDAKQDASGLPGDRVVVGSQVVARADARWLTDPARVYPVTIDPQLNPVSVTITTDRFGENDLRLGRVGSTGPVARSFVHWGCPPCAGIRSRRRR